MGDGNGWVHCGCGHKHWGRHGAAGLLVASGEFVLLQLRAAWTHNGDTWSLPGGARDSHEDALTAATREAREETTLPVEALTLCEEVVDDHGDWSYTTVIAQLAAPVPVTGANAESAAVRWCRVEEVASLPLHFGFARSWPALRHRVQRQ